MCWSLGEADLKGIGLPFHVVFPINKIISENSFNIYRDVNYKGKNNKIDQEK